jgi:hypothetical protein
VLPPQAATAQTIPAFSGADGAAGNITGGRGGIVYHVTKLDQNYSDAVPGTLRYGLSDGNFPVGTKRTLVFDVGGTFWLGRFGAEQGHDNGWDTNSRINLGSNVTVAGQTAPGPVYIMGGLVKASSANAILRNVSIAPGYGMRNFEKPDDVPPVLPFAGDATHTRDFPDSYVYDAIDISAANQLMIDHVSTFYSTDETISANELGNNVTIQYSNISQGQNYPQADAEGSGIVYTGHALGSLLQGGTNTAFSVHHNLYAHQKGRLPRVGSEVGTGAYNDFRNNVFYNWFSTAGTGSGGQPSFNNFVGNLYLAGPGGEDVSQSNGPNGIARDADDVVTIVNANGGTNVFSGSNATGTRVYHSGNLRDINKDGDANDGTALTNSNFGSSSFQTNPVWSPVTGATYNGVTDTATDAFTRVLKYMGANWWTRDYDFTAGNTAAIDTVDERLIHETYTGTGKIKAWADNPFNDYPVPPAGFDPYDPNEGAEWRSLLAMRADTVTGAAPFNRDANWDSDLDGMPNEWEERHGLAPNAAENNGDFDGDGYTNVEEYINELAAWPAASAVVFNNAHADGRYAHILNWDENPDAVTVHAWQPSKYDTAVIDNGTVAVDAVGQHAGNVLLATNPGDNATLNITSGWLKVEDAPHGLSDGAVVIGDNAAATAALNLSGGKLTTKTLLKGAGGSFNFTGGTLSAETVGFDLVNNGGTIAPGSSPGITHVMGDLTINSGALEIEIGGTDVGEFDQLVVDGATTLGGTLKVLAIDLGAGAYAPQLGDAFALVASQNGFDGMFDGFDLPELSAGLEWLLTTDEMLMSLAVVEAPVGLAGDYNGDHVVDAADYSVWRDSFGGTTLLNETVSLGVVDQEDYDAWKANFGATDGEGAGSTAAVPEPSANAPWLMALLLFVCRRWPCLGR